MRPGPIRPGDNAELTAIGEHLRGFNEARADSPGRCRGNRPCPGPPNRFNEARADSPGRYRPSDAVQEDVTGASMRPGPIRPGDKGEATHLDITALASMRPGPIRPGDPHLGGDATLDRSRFNEARADSPGRLGRPARHRRRQRASMRPGPIRPGDDGKDVSTLRRPHNASMRPGPIRPGDPVLADSELPRIAPLQ